MQRPAARTSASNHRRSRRSLRSTDAVSLLKADHRTVRQWFEQFQNAQSDERKQALATRICKALKVHAQIEEEIFYPAFRQETGDDDMFHEALIEHQGAKKLIAEIEQSDISDEFYCSKVKVLSEMIKHHVREEEKPDGMFAEARKSDLNLRQIGRLLAERKAQLAGDAVEDEDAQHVA
jgi:hemerythrin superfamily protein